MKKYFILLSLIPSALMAQTIGVEEAQNKALQFLQGQSQTRASQREVQLKLAYTSKSGDETYYYVFNNANGGYVIMGGDEAAREVLGYGETGSFDYARIPDNMRWWLSQYDTQISQAIKEVKAGTNKVVRQTQTRAERADIPAMLTTKWGQNEPYNCQIPTYAAGYTGENALVTGCEITAFAQIMNYHRWPDTGVDSNTLDSLYYGHNFTADFENTHYDWDAMADSYEKAYSGTREEIAVGTLMYHLGVAFNSTYKSSGTATNDLKAAQGLVNHFRYNKGMSYLFRSFYSDEDWEEIVYDELSSNLPVFYGGLNEKGLGHAFVCDGYKDGHWHINWGWEGNYNNYFLITPTSTEKALLPDGTGTGGGAAGDSYSINQTIITGIYPDTEGNTKYKKLLSMNFCNLNNELFAVGDPVALTIRFQNRGLSLETFDVRIKLINVEDADDYFELEDTCSFTIDSYELQQFETTLCIPEGVNQGATYQIIPLYKDENGEWRQVMRIPLLNYASIKIAHQIELTEQLSVLNRGNACKENFYVSFTIKNLTDNTITYPMVINIYPEDEENAEPVDYFDLSGITLSPREGLEIIAETEDLHYGDRMVVGKNYKLQLVGCANDTLLGCPASCSYLESLTIDITVPEMGWTTFAIPFYAEIPDGLKAYYVLGAYKDDDISIALEKQDDFRMNCAYLLHGAPGTYQVVGPDLELDEFAGYMDLWHMGGYVSEEVCENFYVLDQRDGIVGFYKMHEATRIGKYEAFLNGADGRIKLLSFFLRNLNI